MARNSTFGKRRPACHTINSLALVTIMKCRSHSCQSKHQALGSTQVFVHSLTHLCIHCAYCISFQHCRCQRNPCLLVTLLLTCSQRSKLFSTQAKYIAQYHSLVLHPYCSQSKNTYYSLFLWLELIALSRLTV